MSSLILVPRPRVIDRSRLSYIRLRSVSPIKVPQPVKIDRSNITYSVKIPQIRKINRDHIHYLRPEPSVLEKNILSPETPGSQNFAPFAITPDLEEKAQQRISQYPEDQKRSAVLPLLHEVQHRFGFISPESIDWVAKKLDLSPIKVVEVVTFYPGFRQKAPGKLHFRVCRTLSCAMGGSYELMAKLCELTSIDRSSADAHKDPISVSPCGKYSVEYAECLASCGTAPVCLVNDDFHEAVHADKAQDLIAQYNA